MIDGATGDLFGDSPAPAPVPTRRSGPPSRHTRFFALRPAPADATRLDEAARVLRDAHGIAGSAVTGDRLHVTLESIGFADDDAALVAACRAADALRHAPVDVHFDTALSFRGDTLPFVLQGGAGTDGVRRLRTALGIAMAGHGFRPSPKYEPHLTIGYDRQRLVPRTPIDPIGFRATEFVLIESHVGRSHHEVLRRWTLMA